MKGPLRENSGASLEQVLRIHRMTEWLRVHWSVVGAVPMTAWRMGSPADAPLGFAASC